MECKQRLIASYREHPLEIACAGGRRFTVKRRNYDMRRIINIQLYVHLTGCFLISFLLDATKGIFSDVPDMYL